MLSAPPSVLCMLHESMNNPCGRNHTTRRKNNIPSLEHIALVASQMLAFGPQVHLRLNTKRASCSGC